MSATVLVTGASGTVGSALVDLLVEAGVRVRAGVHSPDAAVTSSDTVETVEIELGEPATLEPAFEDVDRAYLLTPFVPDQSALVENLVAAAVAADVSHLVRQSALGAGRDDPPYTLAADHREGERLVEASGIPFTHLRPTSFMQNVLNDAETIREKDAIYNPVSEPVSFVDGRDVAAVAAAVLTGDGHDGAAYPITGPEAITFGRMAEVLSEVLGREITHVQVSMDDARTGLVEAGMPAELVEGYVGLLEWFEAGGGSQVLDTVETLTGTPARPFDTFARDHAEAFETGAGT
jgi:uncharacterized protein YbjT (DUF2867 family)